MLKVSTYPMFRNETLIVVEDKNRVYKYMSLDGGGMRKIIRAIDTTLWIKAKKYLSEI